MTEASGRDAADEFRTRVAARDLVVGVVGLGYVGLPLAISFAESGFQSVGGLRGVAA